MMQYFVPLKLINGSSILHFFLKKLNIDIVVILIKQKVLSDYMPKLVYLK